MRNPHEEDSVLWELVEKAEEIEQNLSSRSEDAAATDRMTVAIYRVGAALVSSLDFHPNTYTEEIDGLKYALQEIAEALGKRSKSN